MRRFSGIPKSSAAIGSPTTQTRWNPRGLKRTHFHRIIVELTNGRQVTVERIGQAVFPLLRFFRSVGSEK